MEMSSLRPAAGAGHSHTDLTVVRVVGNQNWNTQITTSQLSLFIRITYKKCEVLSTFLDGKSEKLKHIVLIKRLGLLFTLQPVTCSLCLASFSYLCN